MSIFREISIGAAVILGSLIWTGISEGQTIRPGARRFGNDLGAPPPVSSVRPEASWEHLDESALEVQEQARNVCWDMYLHHQYEPDFRATYRETRTLWTLAGRLHEQLHTHAIPREAALSVVRQLDELFHHIEEDVAHWGPRYGRESHHGFSGPYHRRGASPLTRSLAGLETALHHLLEDAGLHRSESLKSQVPPPAQ